MSRWTSETVREGLELAAQTLRAMPAYRCFPDRVRSQWPDTVQSLWEVFNGMSEAEIAERQTEMNQEKTRIIPTPDQVTSTDRIVRSLYILPVRERKVVWARAMGLSWRRIAKFDGRSHEWLRRQSDQHHKTLAANLNRLDRVDRIA